MKSLFLLALGEEEFLRALRMADSGAFFNKLLIVPAPNELSLYLLTTHRPQIIFHLLVE